MNRKCESWPDKRNIGGLRVEAKSGLLVQDKDGFHVIARYGLEEGA
jgi:hypothetical protein